MKAEADPNTIVYFNGQYMPLAEVRIGILTHALHYGTGVFEGIRAYWDTGSEELFLLRAPEHYARWKQNCTLLHIEVPASAEELAAITAELARRNNFRTDLYIRPLAFKSSERIGVAPDNEDSFVIVAMPYGAYFHVEKGLHACVSSWRRVDDNAIPARGKISGAYINSALATDDAHRAGFDEAIFLNNDGHVAEGATCNIFMVRKGRLITPAVTDNILEGITRDSIFELARRELGLEVVERSIDRSELYLCDELFLSGTAVGIAPVVRVDHRPVRDAAIGPIARRLAQLYFEATHGHMPAYRKWLLPVHSAARAVDAPRPLISVA